MENDQEDPRPDFYCYRLKGGRVLYRSMAAGLWGVRRERDSEYHPELVKHWYDTREAAIQDEGGQV